jgi:para-nitrobenzyl esterase
MRPGMPEPIVRLAAYREAAERKFGPMAAQFFELYPAKTDDEAAEAYSDASRDNSRVSTYLWGTEWLRHAHRPVFTYFWTHRPPGPDHDLRGAYHGSEIPYVFGNLYPPEQSWTQTDRKIAAIMSAYWVNYIATGDPNGPDVPRWPPYDPAAAQVMELCDQFALIPVASPEKLAFWKRFFATQEAW